MIIYIIVKFHRKDNRFIEMGRRKGSTNVKTSKKKVIKAVCTEDDDEIPCLTDIKEKSVRMPVRLKIGKNMLGNVNQEACTLQSLGIIDCPECVKKTKTIDKLEKILKYTSIDSNGKMVKTYVNMPKYVNEKGKVIKLKKTDVPCHWCREPFEEYPWKIIISKNMKGEYFGIHNFCSPNCALAYDIYTIRDEETDSRKTLLLQYYREAYGIPIDEEIIIIPAPHWMILSAQGGTDKTMTIEKFRNMFNLPDRKFVTHYPPIIPAGICIEEIITKQ